MTAPKPTSGPGSVERIRTHHIDAHPDNPRGVIPRDGVLEELMASIDAVWLLQPIVVRKNPLPKKHGGAPYQLLAGHRRLRAHEELGLLDIDARVVEVSDAEALVIMVMENVQREDLSPFQEAQAIRLMLDAGWEVEILLSRFGWSKGKFYRRLALTNLSEGVRSNLAELEDPEREWPTRWLEHIAAYPHAIQDELVLHHGSFYDFGQLKRTLENLVCTISSAPWSQKSDPGPDPCKGCSERSDSPERGDLFGAIVGDVTPTCLNPKCWELKIETYIQSRIKELKKEHPELIAVSTGYNGISYDGIRPLQAWMWDKAPKSDEDSAPAIITSGTGFGKLIWIHVKSQGGMAGDQPKPVLTPAEELAEKRQGLEARRRRKALELLHADKDFKATRPPLEVLVPLLYSLGMGRIQQIALDMGMREAAPGGGDEGEWGDYTGDGIPVFLSRTGIEELAAELIGDDEERAMSVMFLGILQEFRSWLSTISSDTASAYKRWDRALSLAAILQVDIQPYYQAAVEKVREPKAWKKLITLVEGAEGGTD